MTENDADVNDCKYILLELHKFYFSTLLKICSQFRPRMHFLYPHHKYSISEEHKHFCDKELTLDSLSASVAKMNSGKSPGKKNTVRFL